MVPFRDPETLQTRDGCEGLQVPRSRGMEEGNKFKKGEGFLLSFFL